MRLPFVSRSAYDAICAEKDARIADLKEQLVTVQLAQKRPEVPENTAKHPEVTSEPPLRPFKAPSILSETIRQEADGDPRLAAYFRKRSRELKAEHPTMSDDGIAMLLSQWETTEPLLDEAVS